MMVGRSPGIVYRHTDVEGDRLPLRMARVMFQSRVDLEEAYWSLSWSGLAVGKGRVRSGIRSLGSRHSNLAVTFFVGGLND